MVLGTRVSLQRCQGAEGHAELLLFWVLLLWFVFFFLPEKQELRSCLPWRGELPAWPSPNLHS